MCQHPSPKNVLLLGGGAEGLLAEILKHPIGHVDYVETDARKIDLLAPFLEVDDERALQDPRVTTRHVDARHFVKTRHRRYDLVIARLPEPMSAQAARFYTDEFYGELRRAMTDRAVLCTTAAATPGSLTPAFAEYLASIRATLLRHFPFVTVGWGNPAHILVATAPGLTTTEPEELMRRYHQRSVESSFFHAMWFDGATDWLSDEKVRQRSAEIQAVVSADVSTDLRPSVYIQRLSLWESAAEGRDARVFESLRSIGLHEFAGGLVVVGVLVSLWSYGRGRFVGVRGAGRREENAAHWSSHTATVLSIGSTGLATMSLSLVWLFAFQNLYGYVYQRIGWIIALFMGGLVAGCAVAGRSLDAMARTRPGPDASDRSSLAADTNSRLSVDRATESRSWTWLVVVDVLIALLCLTVPLLLPALGRLQGRPVALGLVEVSISLMVIATGVLGGAAFAVASRLSAVTDPRPSAVAGSIVGADHAGACLGALLCGVLLVPVFGTIVAAYVLTLTKVSSAAIVLLAWWISRRA
jgi:spermidine synthase